MTNQNTAALLGEDGDIEKLRELSDAAPAGPWEGFLASVMPLGSETCIAAVNAGHDTARFIAGAVNYVRAALARTNNTDPVRAQDYVAVPRAFLEQVYGMACEGCEAPAVAYRWCERIDGLFHGGILDEHDEWARQLPAAIASAPPGAPSDDLSPLLDSLMRAAFDDGDRGREKFSGATMAAREAVLAHVRGASAPPSATVGVEAYLVERLGGEGYGNPRSIIDAAIHDPTKPAFWSSPEAQARHRVTPLVPALAQQPAAPSGEAVGLPNDLRWKLDNLRPGSSGVVTLNREEWDCVRAMFTAPQQPAAVDEAMVERATMALLGKSHDPAPGVDWVCNRTWTVNYVRERMRAALIAAQQPEVPRG